MTTITLAYARIQKIQKNVRSRVKTIEAPIVDWRAVCVIGFFAVLALLILYVWQVNYLTAGSYLVGDYQKQISRLSDENKTLQISFAESSFMGQALEKIHAMSFQKTTYVKYIQVPDNSVAKAR